MNNQVNNEQPIPQGEFQSLCDAVDEAVQILTDGHADPVALKRIGMHFLEASNQMLSATK